MDAGWWSGRRAEAGERARRVEFAGPDWWPDSDRPERDRDERPLPATEFEALRAHLLDHSVKRGDFVLKSGKKSNWFIDSKQTVCRPEAMLLVAEACCR